ncbi:MAG: ABC transporter substrate-binding protein/permease [Prevotella sp.]|jgi:polar amino acid transport system substrate-binding protein|nr:ABC transporter substrate-binding protein/permease [Prevotella sp.]MCH4017632.1 ABC transporter substrate-binding protein/permease [Prevotella sp.]MCI1292316.1 ABC transporter substrate-binding protein/permease [Prevotella sp.]MCI1324499.1 ABC transporter substrate-binding protein/permease [Prevotella sp.]MCI1349234.1 ABC transporter substrate-binding protein/permease [Prevotella sp.]MCI1415338.1 ABC transporter substrate-binding protein/permease [Prevotella sp.]
MKKKILQIGIPLLVIILVIIVILTRGGQKRHTVNSPRDLPGSTIGVQLGTTGDLKASAFENDKAGTRIERYTKTADAIQALGEGKIDCVIDDEEPAKAFVAENSNLKILPGEFSTEEYAFCVARNNVKLATQINEALRRLQNSGALDTIIDRHLHDHLSVAWQKKAIGRRNGTLFVATNATFPPYEYYDNGRICGIDIDVMQAVADDLGMKLDVEDMDFEAVITSVQTGKADVGASALTVTKDRARNVLFTIPYTRCRQVIIVRDGNLAAHKQSLSDKFKANFITEHRYIYLLQGLGNTLVITFFAMILSLVLGSLIAIVRTSHDRNGGLGILNALCRLYLTVIRGTPTMVQLLIIYYVVFASANVSKVFVAIIAFGLNSAAYLAEVVRSGIMSVDRGQMEAGRSLGLSYTQTMRYILLPQAFKNVLPAMGNELITLLKETSISGYIGLVDLTKGSDIIRSITYDALMPLGVVALIYLVIVMALSAGVNRLEKNMRKNER